MNPIAGDRAILCTREETLFCHKHRHAESDTGYEKDPPSAWESLRPAGDSDIGEGLQRQNYTAGSPMCGSWCSLQSLTSAPTGVIHADDPRRSFHQKECCAVALTPWSASAGILADYPALR